MARQGLLALIGDGDESDGNFSLSKLILDWLQSKCNKYISHDIQKELLKVMALHVLRDISSNLQKSLFLTIMIDETMDISNCEQITVVTRSVNEHFEVFEEFIGLYQVDFIHADSLTAVIKDTLMPLNFQY